MEHRALVDLEGVGAGLGGLIHQQLAVFRHDGPARRGSLVQRERELLISPAKMRLSKSVRNHIPMEWLSAITNSVSR